MTPPRVSLLRHEGYEPAPLLESVRALLEPLGGMEAFVRPGDRVVLKPNIIDGRAPEKAVTTHPEVVRAVAQLALDCGGRVAVGESPGARSLRAAAKKSGFSPVMEELGLEWAEFTPVERVVGEDGLRKFTLARELFEADLVINIPKLKTHCMMLMTMAVKNMFGAVLGLQKFQWHLRAGKDKKVFGRVLYDICRDVAPGLSIVDAVVAMDGDGPTAGKPNPTGFLAAGADPSAVDAILMDVVGFDRNDLWTLQAAAEAGDRAWENAVPVGVSPAELRPARWTPPATESADLPLPGFMKKIPFLYEWLREQSTLRPYAIEGECILCGECVAICPPRVMTLETEGIAIDHDDCIRCYCCHEICPQSAIGLKKGFVGRLFERLGR